MTRIVQSPSRLWTRFRVAFCAKCWEVDSSDWLLSGHVSREDCGAGPAKTFLSELTSLERCWPSDWFWREKGRNVCGKSKALGTLDRNSSVIGLGTARNAYVLNLCWTKELLGQYGQRMDPSIHESTAVMGVLRGTKILDSSGLGADLWCSMT